MFILETINNVVYNVAFDWLSVALTKIFVIIAVLQLVKKIPDIINTIFGTHIQSRGGIKGRLGEMAGIGGLAQKAWTSLGTGAKNLAKLGLTAPAAIGYKFADKNYFDKTGRKLSEDKRLRQIKGIGSALRSAWKTGNIMQVANAYDEGTNAPKYKASELLSSQDIVSKNLREKVNKTVDPSGNFKLINDDGSWNNEFINPKTGKKEFVDPSKVQEAIKVISDELQDSKYGEAGKQAAIKLRALANQNMLEGIQKRNDQTQQLLASASKALRIDGDTTGAEELKRISGSVRDGKELTADQYATLRKYESNQDVKDAMAQIKKIENEAAFARNVIADYDGSTGSIAIGTAIGRQSQVVASADKEYQKAITTTSEADKNAMDMMLTAVANAKEMVNGGIQNTGQVESIYNVEDYPRDSSGKITSTTRSKIYADIHYNIDATDPTKTSYVTSSGTVIPSVDSNVVKYITSIREGIVVPSAGDYSVDVSDNNTLALFNDVIATVKSKSGTAGYYAELHDALKNDPIFSTNANVMDAIDKMEESGFLPLPTSAADYAIPGPNADADFESIKNAIKAAGYKEGTKDWYDQLNAQIKAKYSTDRTVQKRVHTYETNYRLPR